MPSFLSACTSQSIKPALYYESWCCLELAVPDLSPYPPDPWIPTTSTAPGQHVQFTSPLTSNLTAHLVAHWRTGQSCESEDAGRRDGVHESTRHCTVCVLSPSHAWSDRPQRKRIRATTKLAGTALPVQRCTATEAAGGVPPIPRPSR